jgi:protein-S-isoprenylcysteine O-methyltransferase Ste14
MEDNPGVRLFPPLLFIGPLIVAIVLEHFWPTTDLPDPWRSFGGGIFVGLGIGLMFLGFREFRKHKTSFVPVAPASAMIQSGIFSRTRNPLYLGLSFIYLGGAIYFHTLWAILFMPLVLLVIRTQVIAKEESYLERKFGADYLEYKSRVRRWM